MSAPLSVSTDRTVGGDWRSRAARRLAVTSLALLLAIALLAAWLLWDNRRLDVTTYRVPLLGTAASSAGSGTGPAGPVRIAQISDLHAADFGTFTDRLLDATRASEPDLIALTGDMIDVRTRDLTGVLDLASELSSLAPTYFVLGNHEADSPLREEFLAGLEQAGITVLRNEAEVVTLGGTELIIAGIDDPRVDRADGRIASSARSDAALALHGLGAETDELPIILLAHRPELLEDYARTEADVVLSGHAHGGQVRLPVIGALFAPHQGWLPELTNGVHTREGTTIVISRGLGNSIAAVRVNNPRELVVLDLERGLVGDSLGPPAGDAHPRAVPDSRAGAGDSPGARLPRPGADQCRSQRSTR
ncbi:metallophosphoesterase [Brachybacterium sp. p3-SID957]|uniref:metallophosphoesterase n=1 Tax=Brachybacterium sp. p3-SID957 TaxID=2916049 RepID=UPI00223C2672|nr:metallophosphoesterase [Brachybacterium sp. p3-SID957]MCT1776883.1 metallophosphoesterase [Brachybacterium sp. p3-SID957]